MLNTLKACFPAKQERYQAATMSWQHPETSYQPATLNLLRAAKSNTDLLAQRQAAWQDAFTGLYHALRHRKCDAFYLATPQVRAGLNLITACLLPCNALSE